MGLITVTKTELDELRDKVSEIFTKYELKHTELNQFDSKHGMSEGDELLVYLTALEESKYPTDFQDDYVSILSTWDIRCMWNRVLRIESDLYGFKTWNR